ncbi:bacteriocin immunity protein [Providencia burhodogranariea]|uniref:Colicin immunity protein/pyocin immunity protein n=1 Tax=Providencia burhodogranariea DSM 19968 TaxID=1141662 RepID=K8WKW9_9GAMM|nr:bacteriocin immunity protein [Providencia burhodogranariea]EKT58122.1 colicin immunity protein/pyocin immunity protein [Providencia burhodogranariea DSM 19968]
MKLKNSISDYTESEFIDFINKIDKENVAETDDKLDILLNHFEKITEHPAGTDLLYYAQSDADSTPDAITKIVKEWRAKNGKPGFKKG